MPRTARWQSGDTARDAMTSDDTTPVDVDALRPPIRPFDLSVAEHVHIVGIGGTGMRAIARVLHAMGIKVSGSDRAPSRFIDELVALGIDAHVGSAPRLAAQADAVTRSTAVPDEDADVHAALEAGVPVLSRAETLTAISKRQSSILVAGTHGKTTTCSLLSVVLDYDGRQPAFIVGADVADFGTGARWSPGADMVIEADESDGTFLALTGANAIVTSLDPDHLEYYGSQVALEAAFVAFVEGIAGVVAVCADDADARVLRSLDGVITYGTNADADIRISEPTTSQGRTRFTLSSYGVELGEIDLAIPGRHNALNAAGAAAIALSLGVDFEAIAAGLRSFRGVARRFELRGARKGITFVDDYAHLPAEVEAAVSTACQGGWSRVVATYQPHRYSRTQALGHTFATSFEGVDQLVLTDIYPSGEQPRQGVSGRIVYDAVVAACPDLDVVWQPTLDDVTAYLAAELRAGDLCLTLGAGDLTTVPSRVIDDYDDQLRIELGVLDSVRITPDAPLGPLTTYRVGGPATLLAEVGAETHLSAFVDRVRDHGLPVLTIGAGSNLLVTDRGFDGVALVLDREFEEFTIEDGGVVRAGAAVPLPVLARQTATQGLAGFEWAVGVPGTIGGAVAMNAGGHGSDMAASIIAVRVFDIESGQIEEWTLEQLDFGYRHSAIGPNHVVLSADLQLEPADRDASREIIREIVRWRREHQPGGQNAGSVFTNPDGDSAGRLIDAAGGKGMREGSAEVSPKHANFIQADPNGSADDIYRLMRRVAGLVEQRFGVELHPETRLVGFPAFTRLRPDPLTASQSEQPSLPPRQ